MKAALGKGLDALIPEKDGEILHIEVSRIRPNMNQPRKRFNDSSLKELAASIKEKGILQPVLVSRTGDGTFNIIAGERRWRAASLAGLKKIPVIIRNVPAAESMELALIENIQREDLNPIEMADAFNRLISEFNLTQEELSEKVGKDRATIANYLRLLKLPEEVKGHVSSGVLSMGHARAILSLDGKSRQIEAARKIKKNGLSVREAELLSKKGTRPSRQPSQPDPQIASLEDKLKRRLATKVRIHHKKNNTGKLEIEYYSLDELDRILEILMA